MKVCAPPASSLLKRQIATEIRDWVRENNLTNRAAAARLKVAASDLSQIVNLQLSFISPGRLLDIWAAAGGRWSLYLTKPEVVDAA